MKFNQHNTRTDYNTVIVGGNVDFSHKDALFMYHAFNHLSKVVTNLADLMPQLTDNIEANENMSEIQNILNGMHNLLMPIAMEIVIPTQGIDIFKYISADEIPTINLKKRKGEYDMSA
jgi:hypothetical protein